MKSIVFDLDDTICRPNHKANDTYNKYVLACPNYRVIHFMKYLHHKDYRIIISSARRMLTHNGDVAKIIEDVYEVTEAWLNKYNVPYDELHFGKPYSSTYYVDDKAMNLKDFYKWVKRDI